MSNEILASANPNSTNPADKSLGGLLPAHESFSFDTQPTRHLLGRNHDTPVTIADNGQNRTIYVSQNDAKEMQALKDRGWSLDSNPGMGGIQGRVVSIATTPDAIASTDLF